VDQTVTPRTAASWNVGVVVPARNEESSIGQCIANVAKSCDASNRCGATWIVVVADRCDDRTAQFARQHLGARGEVLECALGSAGAARRLGAAAVLRHYRGLAASGIWLANTDADTFVPPDWIDTHLAYADANAEAVAGIVQLAPDGLREDVHELFSRTYQLAANGTHEHVHGANFGVRADAYLDAGGWSDIPVSEDHCLWNRLMRRGWRLLSPAASVVHTSARLQGRAIGGFADTLQRQLLAGE